MIRELVSRNVEKLAKYRTGPECGEETVATYLMKTLVTVSLSYLLVNW